MAKWKRKKTIITPEQRVLLLQATLQDCSTFLRSHKDWLPNRTETMEDALKAVTELERATRVELDNLVNQGVLGNLPF